jgi:uncharacterized GH25 family protein
MKCFCLLAAAWCALAGTSAAHDTWLQTNTNIVRTGDVIHVDLLLGNHGNDHRDFKLAGKINAQQSTCEVIQPDGTRIDLRPNLADVGYTPQEGFWTGRFVPGQAGLHLLAHTSDKVVSYAPARSVKSAKAFFVASESLDKVTPGMPGFDRPLGHALELVPLANPIAPMGPGQPIRVRLLYQGKPMADGRVSFIPRGHTLSESFDETYERKTDQHGDASFTPTVGTYYLVVAHHEEPQQRGDGYERTKYSATLCIYVPQICPCCAE